MPGVKAGFCSTQIHCWPVSFVFHRVSFCSTGVGKEEEKGEGRGGFATKRGLERYPGTQLGQRARPILKGTDRGDFGWEAVRLAQRNGMD